MENTEHTLAFASCVRGYHVYKDLWIPVTNEELACRREPGNVHDPCAIYSCYKKRYCRPHTTKNERMFLSPRACTNYGRGVCVQETKIKPTKIHFLT